MKKAEELDRQDVLKDFRERFYYSGEDLIYLDGNSLGRLPLDAAQRIDRLVQDEWGGQLIRSWNTGWFDLNKRLGEKIARLIGAKEHEVILADSTSLNLFKLAYASLKLQGSERTDVISDRLNFPSDLYVLEGIIDMMGHQHRLRLADSEDGITVPEQEIAKLLSDKTALVTLSHVCFKSSFRYDMQRITQMAHDVGALVIWDLSHAAGAVPVDLGQCNADMAVGCTYKFLNGGPGSLAYLYVREDLQDRLSNPVWGWFADENPFDFHLNYTPASGMRRFLTSTSPVLSAAAVEPGLDLLLEAGMNRVWEKSVKQTEYLLELVHECLLPLGFTLGTPVKAELRGSHVSIRHPEGYRISQALIHPVPGRPVIIPDFREPDYIRLGIAPLYISFTDIYRSVNRIAEIVQTKEFLAHPETKNKVT